jgi:hypothetical protein
MARILFTALAPVLACAALQTTGYPMPHPQDDRPAAERHPASFTEVMDPEGLSLGENLYKLRGADFERAYQEHIRYIREAQENARRLTTESEPLDNPPPLHEHAGSARPQR